MSFQELCPIYYRNKKIYFIVTEAMLFPPPKKVTYNPSLDSSVE